MNGSFIAKIAGCSLAIALLAAAAQPAAAYQCKHLTVKAGNSVTNPKAKKKIWAERIAVSGWTRRVKSKYGLTWSVWSIAKSKSVSCNKSGITWHCVAKGRPCKYAAP